MFYIRLRNPGGIFDILLSVGKIQPIVRARKPNAPRVEVNVVRDAVISRASRINVGVVHVKGPLSPRIVNGG